MAGEVPARHRDHYSLAAWTAATSKRRRELATDLERDSLAFVRMQPRSALELPVYEHASGIALQLVPGGVYKIGFSDEEWQTLEAQYMGWPDAAAVDFHLAKKALRPVVEVTLAPFLLASMPLGKGPPPRYKRVAKLSATKYVKHLEAAAAGDLETLAAVERATTGLAAVGMRLPSEAEWEVAARGGEHPRPFPSGTEIPESPNTGANRFGFVDLGAELEVCADRWTPTRAKTPKNGRPVTKGKGRVVRGGAANVYPWQGCGEWALMLCAMRNDGAEDEGGFFTIRPAMNLE